MAQSVKFLLPKHRDLSSEPRTHIKSWTQWPMSGTPVENIVFKYKNTQCSCARQVPSGADLKASQQQQTASILGTPSTFGCWAGSAGLALYRTAKTEDRSVSLCPWTWHP